MSESLFYHLGRKMGPKLRKARWLWTSATGTEAETIQLEHGVGLDLAHEARGQLQIDADPKTKTLLDEIGPRLVAHVANKLRTFQFDAFLCGEPNAFALPGGFVFIGRPLLDLCGWNEHEVAFILGHEMGHVLKGHAIDRIMTNSAVAAAARAPIRSPLGVWLRNVGVRFLETAYSRDNELDADKLGVRVATAAGYDPQGAIRLLTRLGQLHQSPDPLTLGEYLSTHPTAEVRIQAIRAYLATRPASP
ncbi:MAG: M48 family metallopeptidase [Phycisphaerae bacterium]|nr:M48 family metallopeptidase [Phycisphaerae bacterium]